MAILVNGKQVAGNGKDAKINGVNTLSILAGSGIDLQQSNGALTINALAPSVINVTTNTSVSTSAWSSNSTYTKYPYRAAVSVVGVTVDHMPTVTFNPDDEDFDKMAPVCATYNGGVYIYASEVPGSTVNIQGMSFVANA